MSRYFEMTDFWMENLLDDTGDYTIERHRFVFIIKELKNSTQNYYCS